MDKIGAYTNTADGSDEFTEGDPGTGTPATEVDGGWLNGVQRELLEVMTQMGLTPSNADDTLVWQALQAVYGKTFAGDPNGNVAANVLRERCWDTSTNPPALYIATAADGTVGGTTWVALNPDDVVATATDSGTDVYQADLGEDIGTNETFLANVDSANETDSPTFENTGGTPAGAQSVVDVFGKAWIGMLRTRVHRFMWDGTNIVVLDPNGIAGEEGEIDATNGGANNLTDIEFPSLPPGARRVAVILNNVSLDGTGDILVQLGTSGGYEVSGYQAVVSRQTSSGNTIETSSSGFEVIGGAATKTLSGVLVLERFSDSNVWVVSSGNFSDNDANQTIVSTGRKNLSAELDRIRVRATGANSYDGGLINMRVET